MPEISCISVCILQLTALKTQLTAIYLRRAAFSFMLFVTGRPKETELLFLQARPRESGGRTQKGGRHGRDDSGKGLEETF